MTSAPDTAVFPSKRDAWLVLALWGAVAALLAAGFDLLQAPVAGELRIAGPLVAGATAGLLLWVLYGTDYRLEAEEIRIRSGPFRFRVPLAAIESVRPSRSPWSSPACSLDRILIRYGRRRILISPADREGFYRALQARRPDLRRDGDALATDAAAASGPAAGPFRGQAPPDAPGPEGY